MLSLCVIGAAGSTIHSPRRPELVMEAHLPRLQSAIEAFHARCGQLPVQLEDLLRSRDSTGCHGPQRMTPSALRDYWGQPFVYAVTSAGHEFRLLSIGADRRPGTADDIVLGDTHKPWRSSYRPPFEWRRVPVQLAILLLLGMVVWAVVLVVGAAPAQRVASPQRLKSGPRAARLCAVRAGPQSRLPGRPATAVKPENCTCVDAV